MSAPTAVIDASKNTSQAKMSAPTEGIDASETTSQPLTNVVDKARGDLAQQLAADDYPHCIRIAFYDAISYNPVTKQDGPNGSIRIWDGLSRDKRMKETIEKLDKIKGDKKDIWKNISYADLYQLAGVVAVEQVGGPKIEFQHGRMDSCLPSKLSPKDILEDANKDVFLRLGFTQKEIAALSSAHYCWENYSSSPGEQPKIGTSYYEKLLEDIKLKASNQPSNPSATTPTSKLKYWKFLHSDSSFRSHVENFAKDKESFNVEYAKAHKKLSELGFKYFPEPHLTVEEYQSIKHGFAFAVAMTILFGFVGFFYEAMRA